MSPSTQLPPWKNVLAVIAHPDDESFGLGGVIDAFTRQGSTVTVLCLTRGEASTLGASPDLAETRARELDAAARELGAASTVLLNFPDGGLADTSQDELAARVASEARGIDGFLVFDRTGITGHPDHVTATGVAVDVAEERGLPVLAWTLSDDIASTLRAETGAPFAGSSSDIVLTVDRSRQRLAIDHHVSQAVPGSVLWRRLELQGDEEHLIWLRR